MRTLPLLPLVIATVAAGMGCQSDASLGPPPPPTTALTVLPSITTVGGGQSLRLIAQAHNADGSTTTPGGVTWISADGVIASVDADGMVHGLRPGQTRITATWHGNRAYSLVTVSEPRAQKPRPECLESGTATDSDIPKTGQCA